MIEFGNYQGKNDKVDEKPLPFYLNWARKFLLFCKINPEMKNPDTQMESFLVQLGRNIEKWQVDQAREANRLYGYFNRPVEEEENSN